MAKKRVKPESTRNRVEPPTQRVKPNNSFSGDQHHRKNHHWLIIFAVVFAATSALIFHYKTTNTKPSSSQYSYNREGLVKTDVNYQEILNENSRVSENVTHRHFSNPVLAYITPWNSAGYEIAKKFNSKFTHLSPVWYNLKSQGTKLLLEGRHDADTGWLSELRWTGSAQVLPRVVLEALPNDLFRTKKQRENAIDLIVKECKDMDYDGIVLESWSRWAAYGVLNDAALRKMALQFIKQLGDALHKVNSHRSKQLQLVFVIGPPHSEKLQAYDFGPQDLLALSESVDGFSLMTYDYSSPLNPGPNAPLKWVHSILELLLGAGSKSLAKKIFVGINFYGNDFTLREGGGARAITGRDYLSLLDQYKPTITWEQNFAEHFFFYTDDEYLQHAVFYPSLMSVSQRLEEALLWGAGISIWEIGQGLDYFFDLL